MLLRRSRNKTLEHVTENKRNANVTMTNQNRAYLFYRSLIKQKPNSESISLLRRNDKAKRCFYFLHHDDALAHDA